MESKLTANDICEMFEMRVNGVKYEEIAERYQVSRQRVHQILSGIVEGKKGKRPTKACIYLGLREWMHSNDVSVFKLNCNSTKFANPSLLYMRLWGETKFGIDEIKKVLAYTGLTFEEAFGRVESTVAGGGTDE